jgi:predicted nucleotidyltransferase
MDGPGLTSALREIAARYAQALEEALGERLVSVVLYGSVARGETRETSDVDLLVVAEGLPPGRFRRQDVLEAADRRVEALLDELADKGTYAGVSVILKTPDEAGRLVPLYLDMVEDAELLLDRGGFFAGVLERLRESLKRLGARRHRMGRFRYWDLKPDTKPGEIVSL